MSERVTNFIGFLIGAAALALLIAMRYMLPIVGVMIAAMMASGLVVFGWFAASRTQTHDPKPAQTRVIVVLLGALISVLVARQVQQMAAAGATDVQYATVSIGYLTCIGILASIGWSRRTSPR